MTTHAYSQLYLSKASRAVGNMLHDAVIGFGMNGEDFLKRFIQSDIAGEIEGGNPKYIAGKSGMELFLEVEEKTTGKVYDAEPIESYERSSVYWVGAHSNAFLARSHTRNCLGSMKRFTRQIPKRVMRCSTLTSKRATAT